MARLKNFSELSLKKDKDLPNLKIPVQGPKGNSKYTRMKIAYTNAPGTSDIKKAIKAEAVHSADKKPEKYRKPDGKIGIRMVPMDKEIVKREAIVDPNDLKGRPKKADPNPESPYGIKHPMHPANLKKKKVKSEASSPSVLKPTKPSDITKHARTLAKNSDDYERNKKKYIDKARSKVFKMYPRESLNGLMKEEITIDEAKAGANYADMKYHYMYHDDAKAAQAHATKVGGKVLKGSGKRGPEYSVKYKNKNYKEAVDEATWPDEMPNQDAEVDEALNMQQRMKKSRLMKRLKSRIAVGRRRAKKKMANKQTLTKRSNRQARNAIAKKLTRGVPKSELTFARKQEIEKRLDKPALKQRIARLAKRMFKDVRKKEVERKKG
tara:strand:- start:81 stop:1220 length:1140 start_codon:yes stop_codon:yes gene_type:complete